MRKQQQLTFFKTGLTISLLTFSAFAWTQIRDYKNTVPRMNYKGESPVLVQKFYKGEEENYIPQEGKYSGQVFTSELYQGPIEGPGYTPKELRSLHDGFYMGVEAGYDSYKMRSNIDTVIDGVSVFQQNPELNAVGLSYTLLGGYGRVFDDPLYAGLEFFYNDSRANTSQNVGIFDDQEGIYYIKSVILGTYGVSFLPGIKLGDTALLFLKGGYTRLDAKTYETSGVLNINNAQSNGSNGIHFGLGFEVDVCKNWSVRGEYTHVNFQSFTTRLGTRITPSNNQFMFGVILHFDVIPVQ